MFASFIAVKSPPRVLRRLYSDLRIFSQPMPLLAMLCRLENASGCAASEGVAIGDQLLLESKNGLAPLRFQLVMPPQACPAQGRVSVLSPLGAAVYQRQVGDDLVVILGRQQLAFRLLQRCR